MRIKDPVLRKHWMKAHYKEVKVLIDSHTFILGDTPGPDEPVTPTMETNRVKLGSDGKLDKLKVRVVVRGDLQNKTLTEDKWSPTASFCAMKMFLADAARNKARVQQLDFIDFVATADNNSKDNEAAAKLQEEYNIDFASCIGSLIYLALTRTDIIYAVNKLAKFTCHPGETHMLALVHLLRYLRDNTYLGLCFYSDFTASPVYCLLKENHLPTDQLFFTFSDSSWNDDVDHGRSTGCFLIFYMGGAVDHSSNLPDPVALSSAESEYNQLCVAGMATTHMNMFLNELELKDCDDFSSPVSIFLDNSSVIAIGTSFKDTKHTRHILCRYHYVRENVS